MTVWWLQPWNWKMLAPWTKSYDKTRKSVKKQRHYFADKGLYSQSYGFSSSHIWMWKLDFIKKAECWRIDAFELWCWKRLLRVPWTARRSNQSILKEINPEYSFEGLTLKLQYFGQLMPRADLLEKTLMLGKIEGRRGMGDRRWRGEMTSLTQSTWVWANSERGRRTGKPSQVMKPGSFRTELEKRHQNCSGLTFEEGHGPVW